MRGSATRGIDEAEYAELVRSSPPRVIHEEEQLEEAEQEIDRLMAVEQRTPAQDAYLDLLSTLVEEWERRNVDIPRGSAIDVVKFMCEMHDVPQRALVPIFGTASIVSEVLAGKRDLQRKHIAGLAAFFNVSPAVFFSTPEMASPSRRRRPVEQPARRLLAPARG